MPGLLEVEVSTSAQTEFIDITEKVRLAAKQLGIRSGIMMIYCPHTTGAITINEGADPAVRRDVVAVLNQMVPWNFDYRHLEGNSPAHVKSSLIGASEQVIVEDGKLMLGTWQKIFFCEFDGPRKRRIWIKMISA